MTKSNFIELAGRRGLVCTHERTKGKMSIKKPGGLSTTISMEVIDKGDEEVVEAIFEKFE